MASPQTTFPRPCLRNGVRLTRFSSLGNSNSEMAQQGVEPTSALKYMTVPEKIELTASGESMYQRQPGIGLGESAAGEAASRYR